jgi:predicted Fe-S protein YdhL (DUF1289 family)
MNQSQDNIASPCIRNCCLNEEDICLGCFRSITEIINWTQVDEKIRRRFLKNAQDRQAKKAVNNL